MIIQQLCFVALTRVGGLRVSKGIMYNDEGRIRVSGTKAQKQKDLRFRNQMLVIISEAQCHKHCTTDDVGEERKLGARELRKLASAVDWRKGL